MAFAVFKTGGKQYRVQEGDKLDIEKLDAEVDGEIRFAEVLLLNDGSKTTVGTPLIVPMSNLGFPVRSCPYQRLTMAGVHAVMKLYGSNIS